MEYSRVLDIDIWLHGDPIFSLCYSKRKGKNIDQIVYTDITGYRPDPRDFLKPQTRYRCKGYIERETISDSNHPVYILRKIDISSKSIEVESNSSNKKGLKTFSYIR